MVLCVIVSCKALLMQACLKVSQNHGARLPQQLVLLLLLPLMMIHLVCSSSEAAAAAVSAASGTPPLQHAVCRLELRGHSSSNLVAPAIQAANITCTSGSGRKVPVSTNMSHLVQHNDTGNTISKHTLGSITLSGVGVLDNAECKEHAASLNASGSHPLLFFCGNYSVTFMNPLVQQVQLQDVAGNAAAKSYVVFAFAGLVRASISNGSFHSNSLDSIVELQGNASLIVSNSTFSSNQLRHSCIVAYGSSTLQVTHTPHSPATVHTHNSRREVQCCGLVAVLVQRSMHVTL
jgi:hypothetical protein